MNQAGFLGLGRMGRGMAANLARVTDRLTVWNRTRDKADAFAREQGEGVSVAATPSEAARGAQVLVSMVADDVAAEAVHLGPDGTLAADPPPGVVIECGTTSPGTAVRLAAAAEERGVAFVDAPVSGSTDAAQRAELVLLVGGDDAAVAAAAPALDAIGRETVHLGGSGRGALAKLLVNGVLFSLNQAVAEALALAEHGGLDLTRFYDALRGSAAGAPMLNYRREQYLDPDAPLTFTLELAAKDAGLLLTEAEHHGVPAPQTQLVLAQLRQAIESGHGGEDVAALARLLRAEAVPGNGA